MNEKKKNRKKKGLFTWFLINMFVKDGAQQNWCNIIKE
jgi:hypothetical protein